MNPAIVAVRGVSKRYGTVMAVDEVSLDVQPGEVYALLGLNGAGKTTLIRLLLTVALTTTYGLVASAGRGYLVAVAAMFVSLLAAQVIAALGYGAWFPWSVPSLLSGVAGPDQSGPGLLGMAGVAVVGVAASVATAIWWRHADQDQ